MSKDNVKKFFEELEKNFELQKNFDAVMCECAQQTEELFSTQIVDFANRVGFNCSSEDFSDAIAESGELSDEEMQKVAGGIWRVYPPSWWYKKQYSKDK